MLAQWEALDPLAAEEAMRPYRGAFEQEAHRFGQHRRDGDQGLGSVYDPTLHSPRRWPLQSSNWSKWVAHAAIEVSTGKTPQTARDLVDDAGEFLKGELE